MTCVAYTHKVKHKGKHKLSDQKLTKGWAQAACNRMVRDGLTAHTTSIGRGHASPGGPADTAGGRNYSNRLVIKFT